MRSFADNSERLTTHRGLYCVWVRATETGDMPMMARWVDPQMKACEPHENEDSCGEEERGETCLGINLQFV